jgi:hypothetical protein
VTEQETPHGSTPRPIPDLGFFAGPAKPRGISSFGSAPAQPPSSAPAPSRFTTPSVNQFGTAPTATQFGTPQRLDPWGAGPPGAAKTSMSSSVKVVALVIGLVLIAGSVTVGRFGWRHFVADPVVPDTLQGMPQLHDPAADAVIRESQASMGKELTTGSKVNAALYANGAGAGYLLFALRGSSRPGPDDSELKDATQSTYGDVHCFTNPLETGGAAATICMRSFYRRAVVVMGFGADAAAVARATDEAWKAQ